MYVGLRLGPWKGITLLNGQIGQDNRRLVRYLSLVRNELVERAGEVQVTVCL